MSRPEGLRAGPPDGPPIGLTLGRVSKEIGRAFDEALAEAGGSQPTWLILISLKTHRLANQRELAGAVGIRDATLTHHLNAMERAGLLTRQRDPDNRRIHQVRLTDAGEDLFHQLAGAARAFDRRLRDGLDAAELTALRGTLERMRANVVTDGAEQPFPP